MPSSYELLICLFLGPLLTGLWAVAVRQGSLWQRLSVLPTLAALALLVLADAGQQGITALVPLSVKMPALVLVFGNGPLLYYRAIMVLAVYAGVNLYSTGYMIRRRRLYFALLSLFCLGMLTLVLSGNYLALLLGWEVIGLCSYALISTYFGQPGTGGAALRVFLVNRVGDMLLLAAIAGIYGQKGYFGFPAAYTLPTWIGYLIAGAALVKSAQAPFSGWLRLAMAGPTPVSALLHSATLVVAGVLLVLKTGPALGEGPLLMLTVFGMASALYGGCRGLFALEFKGILAWSTVSNMGLLMAGAGTIAFAGGGALAGTGAHILAHAFFKAPLFLLVGLLPLYKIQAYASPQTLVEGLGTQPWRIKVLLIVLILCALSAIGAPLAAGAVSKDALLAGLLASGVPKVAVWSFILAYTMLTLIYVARLVLGIAATLTAAGVAHWVRAHHLIAVAGLSLGVVPYLVMHHLDWQSHAPANPVLEYGYPMFCLLGFVAALLLARRNPTGYNPFVRLLVPKSVSVRGVVRQFPQPLVWLDKRLSELPLTLARAAVVAAYLQNFLEKVIIAIAAFSFRLAQWPVRSLAVNVTGYRISAILAVALLTLAGLVVLVGW